MIFLFRKWLNRLKFIVMFVFLTYALYHVMAIVGEWIEPLDKYHKPTGKSVKVFSHHSGIPEHESISERLKLFYWYGE
jgi:Protein of unknown function (DUF4227)